MTTKQFCAPPEPPAVALGLRNALPVSLLLWAGLIWGVASLI